MDRDEKGRFLKGSRPINAFPEGHIPWNIGIPLTEECKGKSRLAHLGKKASEETKRKMREVHNGHEVSEETRGKISLARLGICLSEETKLKISLSKIGKYCGVSSPSFGKHHSKEAKEKNRLAHLGKRTGKDNPNWQGGISTENHKIRDSFEYDNWRKKVFEKDNYTCQHCGNRGGKLHAHHKKSFAQYPKLRFDVDNGITFCEDYHKTKGLHKKELAV